MLIQVHTAPVIFGVADIPINTGGVLSYGNGGLTYTVCINGNQYGPGGLCVYSAEGAFSCGTFELISVVGDFPVTGPGVIIVFDSSANIIGKIPIQVVGYNPYV